VVVVVVERAWGKDDLHEVRERRGGEEEGEK
jgi:hypothetical protein